MASYSMTGAGNVDDIARLLIAGVEDSGMSCHLEESVSRTVGDAEMRIMVFEKYFYRASNRVSLTVVVTGLAGRVFVDAIGSGGGQGPVFKMSFGAEEDFVATVDRLLTPLGFE